MAVGGMPRQREESTQRQQQQEYTMLTKERGAANSGGGRYGDLKGNKIFKFKDQLVR